MFCREIKRFMLTKSVFSAASLSLVLSLIASADQVEEAPSKSFDVQVSKFGAGEERSNLNGMIRTELPEPHLGPAPDASFQAWLTKYHRAFALRTATFSNVAVVEVKGVYDHAQRPLKALGIPFTVISTHQLKTYDLKDCQVLIVDCPGKIAKESYQTIRDFVSAGGALISTDWTLQNVLEHAFPGYVRFNRWRSPPEVVDATTVADNPVFFAGITSRAPWKLDFESDSIEILNPRAVHIVARSALLASQESSRAGILALTFDFGKGSVLHLIGHFENDQSRFNSDPAPVIGIALRQAIMANFIIARLSLAK